MDVSSTSVVSYYSTMESTDNHLGEMGKSDFLKLITAQLKYQDPLAPADNFDFMSQAAQFNLLEQVMNLNARFNILARLQDSAYANSLIGKKIEWEDGELFEGIVEKVEVSEGLPWLVVGDKYLSPNWIISVQEPEKEPEQ